MRRWAYLLAACFALGCDRAGGLAAPEFLPLHGCQDVSTEWRCSSKEPNQSDYALDLLDYWKDRPE